MKKSIFDREFFVQTGRKGGLIGGKKLKEKYPHEHFVQIGKLGGRPKKKLLQNNLAKKEPQEL